MNTLWNFDINHELPKLEAILQHYPGGSAVTIGKFDGIHRGHQLLLQKVTEKADRKKGVASVVISFGKAPYEIVHGETKPVLTVSLERGMLLEKHGIDLLVELPFTEKLRNMEPEAFVEAILVQIFHCTYVAVGTDFCFGKNRRGNGKLLLQMGEKFGFETEIIAKAQAGGRDIGSTRIAEAVSLGNMEEAGELLGHSYFLVGEVCEGNKLGRTLGFPTINILPSADKLLPPNGVYVSRTRCLEEEAPFEAPSITNIGTKPTVSNQGVRNVETHLFDRCEDMYGKPMLVELIHYIRPERRFSSREELVEQVQKDSDFARTFH